MSQRDVTINNRLRVVENTDEHGTWSVYDVRTGQRLTLCARLVSDLVDLLPETMEKAEE